MALAIRAGDRDGLMFFGTGMFALSMFVAPGPGGDWALFVIPGVFVPAIAWFGWPAPFSGLASLLFGLSLRAAGAGHLRRAVFATGVAIVLGVVTLGVGALGLVAWPGFPEAAFAWWIGLLFVEISFLGAFSNRLAQGRSV